MCALRCANTCNCALSEKTDVNATHRGASLLLCRLRQAVNVAAPGTMDRHNRRVAVLEVARAMMEGRCAAEPHTGMGCASPYAFETALRLLEIEEEIAGAHLPRTSSTVSCWAARIDE